MTDCQIAAYLTTSIVHELAKTYETQDVSAASENQGPLAFELQNGSAVFDIEQVQHDELVANGFELFAWANRIDGPIRNAVFSPYVLQIAMAAVYARVKIQTADEIARAMKWRLGAGDVLQSMGLFERRLAAQLEEENKEQSFSLILQTHADHFARPITQYPSRGCIADMAGRR